MRRILLALLSMIILAQLCFATTPTRFTEVYVKEGLEVIGATTLNETITSGNITFVATTMNGYVIDMNNIPSVATGDIRFYNGEAIFNSPDGTLEVTATTFNVKGIVSANELNDGVAKSVKGTATGYVSITSTTFTDGTAIISAGDIAGTTVDATHVEADNLYATNLESDLDGTGKDLIISDLTVTNLESDVDGTGKDLIIEDINAGGIVTADTLVYSAAFKGTNLEITNLESDVDGTAFDLIIEDINSGGVVTADTKLYSALVEGTNAKFTNLEAALDGTGFQITAGTFTDGTISITGGKLTSAVSVSATEITDGTASLIAGDLSSVGNAAVTTIDATNAVIDYLKQNLDVNTFTLDNVGQANITTGSITNLGSDIDLKLFDINNAGIITANTMTDGTASLSSGSLVGGLDFAIATADVAFLEIAKLEFDEGGPASLAESLATANRFVTVNISGTDYRLLLQAI